MKTAIRLLFSIALCLGVTACKSPILTTGTLSFTVSWPNDGSVINPVLAATLTPAGGPGVPLTAAIVNQTATHTSSLEQGSYTLHLELRGSGAVKWRSGPINLVITPGSSSTAGPFPLAAGDIAPDFVEDFSDGTANGWEATTTQFAVTGGAYAMTQNGASDWASSYYIPKIVGGNFTYQARINLGNPSNLHGIFLNATSGASTIQNGYAFCAYYNPGTSSYSCVVRTYTDGIETASSGTLPAVAAPPSCILKAEVSGGSIAFSVDGTVVYTLSAPLLYTSGYVGLTCINLDTSFWFDDISLVSESAP